MVQLEEGGELGRGCVRGVRRVEGGCVAVEVCRVQGCHGRVKVPPALGSHGTAEVPPAPACPGTAVVLQEYPGTLLGRPRGLRGSGWGAGRTHSLGSPGRCGSLDSCTLGRHRGTGRGRVGRGTGTGQGRDLVQVGAAAPWCV